MSDILNPGIKNVFKIKNKYFAYVAYRKKDCALISIFSYPEGENLINFPCLPGKLEQFDLNGSGGAFVNFNNQNLSIDVSLHIGSFLAVIIYFKNDIFNFIKNRDIALKIIISSIPIIIVGYILVKLDLIDKLRNIKTIGWATIIFGVLLYYSDKFELSQ